jgi:dTDP-4-dehydrorhamnose reductase
MTSHLVVGGSGFLGRGLLRALGPRGFGTYNQFPIDGGSRFLAPSSRIADVERLPHDLSHVFVLYGVVDPDVCFREPERSRAINVTSTIALLRETFEMGLTPVYMSTDYVFDGSRGGRTEQEAVCPTTNYGRQKAEVEAWLERQKMPYLVCRASKIVSGDVHARSVLGQWTTDIRQGRTIRCATDQIFSPGYVDDIAHALVALVDLGHSGVFHVAGPEPFSRYELARLFIDRIVEVDPAVSVELCGCRLSDIPFAETRPLNTSLSIEKLAQTLSAKLSSMDTICRVVARLNFG